MIDIPKRIIVKNEAYQYGGDIPNTIATKQSAREVYGREGNKVAFRKDPMNSKVSLVYISVKTFSTIQRKYRGY
jgi:hypothetical protein